jgi:hypothetical protein
MNRKNEKGVALILALIFLLVMSVMAVSLMFISQTETWSSLNYKLMSQARDGAEAGINAGANYLINTYTPPTPSGTDQLSKYNYNVSPVQTPAGATSGEDVFLATTGTKKANNYPVSSVITGFQNTAEGSLTAGNLAVTYATSARLLSMEQVTPWGTTVPVTVQTWHITSDGTINGVRNADEELSAILEKQVTPVFTYAAFTTGSGCGSLNFGGGGTTASYNSGSLTLSGGVPVTSTSGGSVGTNGNLFTNGKPTTINGSLSTPRTGTGTCSSGGGVDAWTSSGGSVTGGLVHLPQAVVYPPPATPNPAPPTTQPITLNNSAADCGGVTGCTVGTGVAPSCASGDFCLAPGICPTTPGGPVVTTLGGLYGDVTVKGTVHLSAGCYNINSLIENGGGALTIDSGPVVVNVAGAGTYSANPINLTGGGVINTAGWGAQMFQLMYAGTGTVNLKGGANAVGVVYAPNATIAFNSAGGNWYGSVIGGTMTDMGGATLNYDANLKKQAVTVGNWMLDSFTWRKN